MPFGTFGPSNNFRKTEEGLIANQLIGESFAGKYVYYTTDSPIQLTLSENVTSTDAEIDFRNSADSTEVITIASVPNVTINVNSDLGLVIPIGGIGELKRRGSSNTWDFYGYIEA